MTGITVGTSVEVNATWSVTDAAQGDTFSLGLPAEIEGVPTEFDMLDPEGATIGTCQVTTTDLVCTLGDYVEQFQTVSGSLFFWSYASAENTSGRVVFENAGGTDFTIDVPGGGIGPEPLYPFPTAAFKDGEAPAVGSHTSSWSIYVPATTVLASNSDPYVIEDTHDPSLTLLPESLEVYYVNSAQWQSADRWSHNQYLAPSEFTLSDVTSTGFTVAIDKAAIRPENLYIVKYEMTVPADAQTGDTFTNTATGSGLNDGEEITFQGAGGGGDGSNDPRSIQVIKRTQGPAPAGALYEFSLACTDPQGAAVSGFPRTFLVSADQSVTVDQIPVGSSCALTETDSKGGVASADLAGPIKVERTSPALVAVTVTNTFETVPTPTPTDPVTPTPVIDPVTPTPTCASPATSSTSTATDCPVAASSVTPSRLPSTGAETAAIAAGALGLALAGLVVVVARRRSAL